jgi:hypothetical protein
MSSTANHKKVLKIVREACHRKGLLRDIFFIIGEDQPSAIANAYDKLMEEERPRTVQPAEYKCPECEKNVSALGIGGACGVCDPRGISPGLS